MPKDAHHSFITLKKLELTKNALLSLTSPRSRLPWALLLCSSKAPGLPSVVMLSSCGRLACLPVYFLPFELPEDRVYAAFSTHHGVQHIVSTQYMVQKRLVKCSLAYLETEYYAAITNHVFEKKAMTKK